MELDEVEVELVVVLDDDVEVEVLDELVEVEELLVEDVVVEVEVDDVEVLVVVPAEEKPYEANTPTGLVAAVEKVQVIVLPTCADSNVSLAPV